MNKRLISNVIIGGIDTADYPDFCDAYIESAWYEGKPMTEEQLDFINEDPEYIYECVMKQLY